MSYETKKMRAIRDCCFVIDDISRDNIESAKGWMVILVRALDDLALEQSKGDSA